jgi:hypothetical protein
MQYNASDLPLTNIQSLGELFHQVLHTRNFFNSSADLPHGLISPLEDIPESSLYLFGGVIVGIKVVRAGLNLICLLDFTLGVGSGRRCLAQQVLD